jgi:hypothetical protein
VNRERPQGIARKPLDLKVTHRTDRQAVCDGLDKGQTVRRPQEDRRSQRNPGQDDSHTPQREKGGADGPTAQSGTLGNGFGSLGQKLCPMLI